MEKDSKSILWLFVFCAVVVVTSGALVSWSNHRYETLTPPEVKAKHQTLANQAGALKNGDLIKRGSSLNLVADNKKEVLSLRDCYADAHWDEYPTSLSRERPTPEFIRMSDPGWPAAIKQYFEQCRPSAPPTH